MQRLPTAPLRNAPGGTAPLRLASPAAAPGRTPTTLTLTPQAAARPQADTQAADRAIDQTVRDVLGRGATAQELAAFRGRGDQALREALVNTPEFAQKARTAWEVWGKQNSRQNLGFDQDRLKAIKEKVVKGATLEKAIGFTYTGGYYAGLLFAAYLKSVEKESQERRARGA